MDEATHTAYVGNGNDNTVSVINTATCNARVTSGCGQVPPTITVGPGPVDDAVDEATDTIYVVGLGANNPTGDTVSVIDGATCNAMVTSGCGQTPPTVTVGSGPDGVAVDQATDTIYVANVNSNTVSVINGALCNGQVTSGCGQTPATVPVGVGPGVPAVDQVTDTIYVPNSGSNTLSVIDGATCNALVTTGCDQSPSTLNVGPNAFAAAVDDTTGTVYVTVAPGAGTAATTLGYLDVINGSTCNATVTSGCEQVPATVAVGSIPVGAVVDQFTGEVYVLNQEDGTVSIVDGAICNALDTAGCAQSAPELETGFEPGYLDIDVSTETVYVTNQDENDVSVLNAASCNLAHQFGCEHPAPTSTVGTGPQGIAADQKTATIYVANQNDDDLSVVDGATCNGWVRSGCARSWPTVAAGNFPQAVAVDERTDTVYVANTNANTVSVINGASCNASVTTGCGQGPATVSVGEGPAGLAVNELTDTIYVANSGDNTVSVINGATCNGAVTSGCSQPPPRVSVGNVPIAVAADEATNAVYVANAGDSTVSVIDGATCNGADPAGCTKAPPTVSVAPGPDAVAVDQTTDTVYVSTGFFNFSPSAEMSVIDGTICNATVTSGCGQAPVTMQTGGFSYGVAVDQATGTVFADSIVDSDLEVFNGATCNSVRTFGCSQVPRTMPTGGWPGNLALLDATGTVYASDNVDGTVSFWSLER